MNASVQIILSLLLGVVAATILTTMKDGSPFDAITLVIVCSATLAATLVGRTARHAAADYDDYVDEAVEYEEETPSAPQKKRRQPRADTTSGAREGGKVKWFNASKGFGFIVKDDGDEIFVHFRSIRGADRRGLKDGQRVNFVVADSDKGPQAEDVIPE